jgi:hypothetical protein
MTDEPIKKKDLTDFISEINTKIDKITSANPSDETPSQGTGGAPPPAPDDSEVAKLKKQLAASQKLLADNEKAQKTKILESFDKERKEKYKDASLEVLEAVKEEQSDKKAPFISEQSRSQGETSEKKKHAYLDRMNEKIIYH